MESQLRKRGRQLIKIELKVPASAPARKDMENEARGSKSSRNLRGGLQVLLLSLNPTVLLQDREGATPVAWGYMFTRQQKRPSCWRAHATQQCEVARGTHRKHAGVFISGFSCQRLQGALYNLPRHGTKANFSTDDLFAIGLILRIQELLVDPPEEGEIIFKLKGASPNSVWYSRAFTLKRMKEAINRQLLRVILQEPMPGVGDTK